MLSDWNGNEKREEKGEEGEEEEEEEEGHKEWMCTKQISSPKQVGKSYATLPNPNQLFTYEENANSIKI